MQPGQGLPNGKVVVLRGPPGNFHADARRASWKAEFFDKRPDVKIVGEDIANARRVPSGSCRPAMRNLSPKDHRGARLAPRNGRV